MKRNKLFSSIQYATLMGAVALPAFAADETPEAIVEEVVVTGSMIQREDLDGALPIQVLGELEIKQTGVTNVADLIESIPQMQGFTAAGETVGGGGGGNRTASLKNLGEQYTLSLLNGRRMAPQGSGSAVNLGILPLSVVEKVDVLTDGASSLYGSDAIAGVVNFQLRDEFEGTTITARNDVPTEDGGSTKNFDITSGFGSFDTDGYSVVLSYSAERQEQLKATQRDFARTGIINFEHQGRSFQFNNTSINSIPGNASVSFYKRDEEGNRVPTFEKNDDGEFVLDADGNRIQDGWEVGSSKTFNPYLLNQGVDAEGKPTGNCPEQTLKSGETCRFDFTNTLEIMPEYDRDTFFANAKIKLGDAMTAYGTVIRSENSTTARLAPFPTGGFTIDPNSQFAQDYFYNHLTEAQRADIVQTSPDEEGNTQDVLTAFWRGVPTSNRTIEYKSVLTHLITGLSGEVGDINFDTGITYSNNERETNYLAGYLHKDRFQEAVNAGTINVFEDQASHTSAYEEATFTGNWSENASELLTFDAKGSMPVFELDGGDLQLGFGVDARTQSFSSDPSEANQEALVLNSNSDLAYDLERSQYGVFTEVYAPLLDNFEVTASLRYDDIGGVDDSINNVKTASMSDITYKVNARWDLDDTFTVRASTGTGFRAPSMLSAARPLTRFGVSGGSFDCPFAETDERASLCRGIPTQYPRFSQGNPDLQPETSKQFSVGFVMTPSEELSVTIDYWTVSMENLIASEATENQIFNNPETFNHLFITDFVNPADQRPLLAYLTRSINVGESITKGVDYNIKYTKDTPIGIFSTSIAGAHLIEDWNSQTFSTSYGAVGDADSVTFPNKVRVNFSLAHGNFLHNLGYNYQSSYLDRETSVRVLDDNGVFNNETESVQLTVPSYANWNYSSNVSLLDDSLSLTVGVNNLFDEQPPLSLLTGNGHQVGYDARYFDSYGRTIFAQAQYNF